MASMVILVAFALQGATPASAETSAQTFDPVKPRTAAKDAPEKMICKRHVRTGTLAGIERTCYTRSEWQRLANHTRDGWKEMQGIKGSTNGQPPEAFGRRN